MIIIDTFLSYLWKSNNIKGRNNMSNIYIKLLNSLVFYLIILLKFSLSKEKSLTCRQLNLETEITMTIIGTGEQKILSIIFPGPLPDFIYVNEQFYGEKTNKVNDLAQNENRIKMVWNSPLTTCFVMFYDLPNIINMDFSKFDTSKVTTMEAMFNGCISLTSLYLGNFNTSSVESMKNMFYNDYSLEYLNLDNFNTSTTTDICGMFFRCAKLTSLDLRSFNTSLVTDMSSTFHDCNSLKYLDISSFNTSSVKRMYCLFYNCSSLTSLDIRHFDTSSVENMQGMFGQMHKIISLDLSNLNTENVYTMEGMFGGSYSLVSLELCNFDISKVNNSFGMFFDCASLIFLNLDSFIEAKYEVINTNNMFLNINKNVIFCLHSENNIQLTNAIPDEIINNNNCDDICFSNSIKIDIYNNSCIDNCQNTDYKYEYNKICYFECPENTHISPTNNYLCIDNCKDLNKYYNYARTSCINNIPQGYFINDTFNKTVDKCHPDCKKCERKYDENNSYCNSCLNDKFLYFGNCLTTCNNGYIDDNYGNKICKCFNNKCYKCSIESNKLDLCISCNEGYYPKIDDISNNNSFIDCYKDLDGYYLDNDTFKPCYSSCKKCTGFGDISDNKCLSCNQGYFSIDNGTNCNEICQYYYYFNESNIYHCTEGYECPLGQNKLIKEKKKCIKNCSDDDTYKCEFNNTCYKICPEKGYISEISNTATLFPDISENVEDIGKECPINKPYQLQNNNCVEECNAIDFFNGVCKINNDNLKIQEHMIENIKSQLNNKDLNELLLNVTDGEKKDLLIKVFNTTYQITTTENQNNNEYSNLSRILLHDCEDILREQYHINNTKPLPIFKVDYYSIFLKCL